MMIYADECVYQLTVDVLKSWGFSVITVQEAGMASYRNGDVLAYSQQESAVFLTRDKDFTDTRIYPPGNFCGIIVLKISPHNQDEIHETLHQCLSEHILEALQGKLALIDRTKYHIVDEQGHTLTVLKK